MYLNCQIFAWTEVWLNFLLIFFLLISCPVILLYKFLYLLYLLLKVVQFRTSGLLDERLLEHLVELLVLSGRFMNALLHFFI